MSNDVKREKKEIIIDESRGFKGVWITERLYLTREFTPNEKFVLIEIYSLTKNKSRQCFASNKHFADFVGLKENTIQKMMLKFENAGYIKRIYEYKKNSKEIDKRIIVLTNKFYDSFINESENLSSDPMENNPHGNGFNSIECGGEKSIGEVDKKSEISNTSFKYNNDLSNTDSSITERVDTLSSDNAKAYTSVSKKQLLAREKKRTKSEFKELEADMIRRFDEIGSQYNVGDTAYKNVAKAFRRYLKRYTQKTGKIHPILKDETLEKIFVALSTITDTQYCHFENVADSEPDSNGVSCLDDMVDEHFRVEHRGQTDYHITHFVNEEYLEKLANHVVEW